MKCKCGEQGELKVFNTFQYYFCTKCKKEIEFEDFPKKGDEVDDPFAEFYLDLAKKELREAVSKIDSSILRDLSQCITIALPNISSDSYHYKIYRNPSEGAIWKDVEVQGNIGSNWKIIELKGKNR